MQAGNVKYFTDRLDALQKAWNCSDVELCKRIGFSRQLLYLMRSGEQEPSKKTVRLLEMAEQQNTRDGAVSKGRIALHYAVQRTEQRPARVNETNPVEIDGKEKLKHQIAVLEEALRIAKEMLSEK